MAFVWYMFFLQMFLSALGEQPAVPQEALPKDADIAEPRPQLPFLASGEQEAVPKETNIAGSPPQVSKTVEPPLAPKEPPLVPKAASLAVAPGTAALPKSSLEPANEGHKEKAEADENDSEDDVDAEDDEDEDDAEDDAEERKRKKRKKGMKMEAVKKRKEMMEDATACHEKCADDASCHFECPSPFEWEHLVKACQRYRATKTCYATCKDTDCGKCAESEDETISILFNPQRFGNLAENWCPKVEEAHACHQACKPADHECHHECSSIFHYSEHEDRIHHDEDEEDNAEERMMETQMRRKAESKRWRAAEQKKQIERLARQRAAEQEKQIEEELADMIKPKDGLEIDVSYSIALSDRALSDRALSERALSDIPKEAIEPSPIWLAKIPLLAALLSFAGFLAYSMAFICRIFNRALRRSQNDVQKASVHNGFEDLESALDMAVASTGCLEQLATPVVRKMAQSQEVSQACASGWDNELDALSDAGCGDAIMENESWSDVADCEGQAAPDDVDNDELQPKLQVKGKGD